jgi:hypothetical protein
VLGLFIVALVLALCFGLNVYFGRDRVQASTYVRSLVAVSSVGWRICLGLAVVGLVGAIWQALVA